MRVGTTKDAECNYIRALLYGDSGIGKTTSLCTLPEKSTLVVSAERGLLPLRDHNFRTVSVRTWAEVQKVGRALWTGETAKDGSLTIDLDGEIFEGIRTVAFDSLTMIQKMLRRQLIAIDRPVIIQQKLTESEKEEQAASGVIKKSPDGMYDDQMLIPDHGVLKNRLDDYLIALTHSHVHLIMTALSGERQDPATKQNKTALDLSGALARSAGEHFDLVFYMQSNDENVRTWQTFNDGSHICKGLDCLEDFEDPDWTAVFSKVTKGAKRKGAK